jgi:AAA family ATP:ADP antiporter
MIAARRAVLAPMAILFAIMVAHALLETARDALFLARLGPTQLAWAYLTIAMIAMLAVTAVRRWGGVRDPRRMLIVFLVLAVVGTAILAATVTIAPSVVFVLYVWTGVVATLVIPCFWTLTDRSLRVAEAKRTFATIGAGGVLGALVGSAIAGFLGSIMAAHHLVTAGAIAFVLATGIAIVVAPRLREGEPIASPPAEASVVNRHSRRYLRLLVGIGIISTVALTLGDLTFKRVLAERLSPDDLATVFGAIYTGLNVLSLAIQLVLVPRLLSRFGVTAALTILPVILIATALGFALTGVMVAIIALRIGDGGLRHSVHRIAGEILFLPLPSELRDRAKPIADAIGHRGGQAAAALIAFAAAAAGAGARVLAVITAAIGVTWLLALAIVRHAYAAQFRDMLQAGQIRRDVHVPDLDAQTSDLLVESLASPDEVEALAALDLLARDGGHRVPALVLYHPHARVVRRALQLLDSERPDVVRTLRHLYEHADPQIRAGALAVSTRVEHERLRQAAKDNDPELRAAALIGLSNLPGGESAAVSGLAALVDGSTAERLALARAIGFMRSERLEGVLHDLLAYRETSVMREVLQIIARMPALADLEQLLALLADPHVRGDVRKVFLAAGTRGLGRLVAALDDPRLPLEVRQHLPRTISRFGTRAAATALVARLPREPDGTTEFKILRAVGRMRTNKPDLPIDTGTMRAYALRAIAEATQLRTLADRLALEPANDSPATSLLRDLLVEKYRYAIEHAFRAIGVLYPRAELRTVHDAATTGDPDRKSAGLELLEHLLPLELRLPMLDALADTDRRHPHEPTMSYEELVSALLTHRSESLRCVVAYHVAERHLVGLRGDLARLRRLTGSPLVTHAFDQAIARLDA